MSKFNTQIICFECKEKEKKHPKYKEADEAEVASVRRGERNFPGIDLPADLEDGGQLFAIEYHCPDCQHVWHETWSCACDSTCPACGCRNIEAFNYEEVTPVI